MCLQINSTDKIRQYRLKSMACDETTKKDFDIRQCVFKIDGTDINIR